MAIHITPDKVNALWPSIKYAAVQANNGTISDKNLPSFLNKLLASLLDGRVQCFVRVDDTNKLQALALAQINEDKVSGERFLLLLYMYSFEIVSDQQWIADFNLLRAYAADSKCSKIIFNSSSPRVHELAVVLGFSEYYRCFKLELE